MPKGKRLTDEDLREALQYYTEYRSVRKAAKALGLGHAAFAERVVAAKECGFGAVVIKGDSSAFYAPPPPPPKLRVSVSHVKSDPGWDGDVLAIGDMHDSPKLDKKRFLWCGRAAVELQVARLIQIGDFISVDSLCKMEGNDTLRGKDKPSFEQDVASGHEAMSSFDRGLNGSPIEKHITMGNHEERALSFTNRTPEVAGILTGLLDNLFMSHGWTYSPYGLVYYIGSVGFVHAPLNVMGKPYGGVTALQRVANDAVHDLVYGHTHKGGEFHRTKIGTNQHVTVLDLGCALPQGHIEPYVGHSMSGWRYGVYLLKIRDGRLQSTQFITMDELEQRFGD